MATDAAAVDVADAEPLPSARDDADDDEIEGAEAAGGDGAAKKKVGRQRSSNPLPAAAVELEFICGRRNGADCCRCAPHAAC